MSENKMREIRIEKVTLNIGVGEPGDPLRRAKEIANKLTGMKIVETKCKIKQPSWGIRPGLSIGAKATIRGKKAYEFLESALKAKDNTLRAKSFDKTGNFGFGIAEYIDIPGTKYDPKLGIQGLDIVVTLERPGYRIKKRKIKSKIGKSHLISKEEGIEFIKNTFNVEVV